jgi:hypothetical protein
MNAFGMITVTEPPEFFAALLRSEHAKYAKLTRDIGLRAR